MENQKEFTEFINVYIDKFKAFSTGPFCMNLYRDFFDMITVFNSDISILKTRMGFDMNSDKSESNSEYSIFTGEGEKEEEEEEEDIDIDTESEYESQNMDIDMEKFMEGTFEIFNQKKILFREKFNMDSNRNRNIDIDIDIDIDS